MFGSELFDQLNRAKRSFKKPDFFSRRQPQIFKNVTCFVAEPPQKRGCFNTPSIWSLLS
jgi:hypothetical protein